MQARRERVLIVDDDARIRALLALALEDDDVVVTHAASGPEALAALDRATFAAVLLDNRMPGMTGFEVLRAIRAREDLATLPVVFVTADEDVQDRVRALRAGATDYVVKPFHPDEVVARLRAHMRGTRAWNGALQERLRERTAVAAALARITASADAATTADAACRAVTDLPDVLGAAVLRLQAGVVIPLAVHGTWPWSAGPGEPVRADVAARIEARVALGPGIESGLHVLAPPPGHAGGAADGVPDALACAPLGIVGNGPTLLALACAGHGCHPALSAAIDLGEVVANLLAPSLSRDSQRTEQIRAIDGILERGAFTPFFQPILRLGGAEVVGFEALTRFHDGTPPLARFSEAARLDRGIALEGATVAGALEAAGSLPADAWVSVNVSPALVLRAQLLRELVAGASRSIVLELTEHDRVDDYKQLRGALAQLGDEVRLSIDDAGSGFSSLRHVLVLEPDYIKLDRSWVAGIADDQARRALVAGLVHFADQTGCGVIAEGIESGDDLRALSELGVGFGQGYLLGVPAPAGRR